MEYISGSDDASEISRNNREIPPARRTSVKISRYYRYMIPPAHISFKIESFSDLLKSNTPKHQSDKFWASGFNWRVSVHPKGRNNGDEDYLSMYLEIVDTHTLTQDWEVHASYKLFVYDRRKDKYYTIQDVDSKIRRFNSMKTEWGFDRVMKLQTLTNASKGYIHDDACVFGAEVFVIKQSGLTEEVNPYTWKVEKFSTIKDKEYHNSKTFVVGGYAWCLSLYPNGNGEAKNKSLSLFLQADWVQRNPQLKLYVEYKLRIKNLHNNTYHTFDGSNWFGASGHSSWGFRPFISLVDLNDASKGFLLNDTIILQVEFTTLSLIKK